MKVLMIARNTLFSSPGGDTVQIKLTAEYLIKLGVAVEIKLSSDRIDYNSYNLLHFFNIIRPDDILPHISKTDLPFVVSTIFVDYSEYEMKNRKGLLKIATTVLNADQLEYVKAIARYAKNGDKINSRYYLLHGHRKSVKFIAQKASMLLPNSHSEYNRFWSKYGISSPYRKIPNAIDVSVFNEDVQAINNFSNHILCVGRIEGRKNQLNLIKAIAGTDLYLTIIGKPSPNHLSYYDECKRIVDQNNRMQIIEHIDHSQLAGIYKAAKVHVLPSWFETTGLSSLEAGVMDCNVVVTKKGDTEEYFEDLANYRQPDDVSSIRDAVLKAYHDPVKTGLKEKIRKEYTWHDTARETLEAYKTVLKK